MLDDVDDDVEDETGASGHTGASCAGYGSPRTGGGEVHLGQRPKKAGPRWGTPRATPWPPGAPGGDNAPVKNTQLRAGRGVRLLLLVGCTCSAVGRCAKAHRPVELSMTDAGNSMMVVEVASAARRRSRSASGPHSQCRGLATKGSRAVPEVWASPRATPKKTGPR